MPKHRNYVAAITVAVLASQSSFAAVPLYQGYLGEQTGGPLYIHNWSVPSMVGSVPTLGHLPGST